MQCLLEIAPGAPIDDSGNQKPITIKGYIMKKKKSLVKNQKGQGVMEYVLITSLIGIFCLAAVKKIGKSLDTRLNSINKKIQKEVVIK
jgi:Flp pilus assembly pilin Flp